MKEKLFEKGSNRAELTPQLGQSSQSVTTMMSQTMSVKCMKTLKRLNNGMRAIVRDKTNLQKVRMHTTLWTTSMCGGQRIRMRHDMLGISQFEFLARS